MRIFRFSLEKRLVLALPSGMPICSQISCASPGWELPEKTFKPEMVTARKLPRARAGLAKRVEPVTLRQGFVEDSSVDPVREVTELIEAQRGYELNSKVISAADQMLGATTQVR